MKIFIVAAITAVTATPATAQVFKCTDATGRTVFSQTQCQTGGVQLNYSNNRGVAPMPAAQRPAPAYRVEQQPQQVARSQQLSQAPAPQSVLPSDSFIRDLEVSASSVTISQEAKAFLLAELSRVRAARNGTGLYSANDWDTLREAYSDTNRIGPGSVAAARSKAEGVHMRASAAAREQIAAQRQAEEQMRNQQAAQPSNLTNCDSTGCWDNVGNRYTKGAGTTFFRQDGKTCQANSGMLNCN